MNLDYCPICIQETNHLNGVCQKCKPMNYIEEQLKLYNKKYRPNTMDGERIPKYEMTNELLDDIQSFLTQSLQGLVKEIKAGLPNEAKPRLGGENQDIYVNYCFGYNDCLEEINNLLNNI